MSITFKAPCDSSAVDGMNVYYRNEKQTFTYRDAHGNDLSGRADLFSKGAYVKAILDTGNGYAYIQNADTNGYLEATFDDFAANTYTKSEVLSGRTKALYALASDAKPDDAFAFTGKYNTHWWTVQRGLGKHGYNEEKTPTQTNRVLVNDEPMSGMGGLFVNQYSTAIEFSDDGTPTLKDPISLNLSYPHSAADCEAFANAILAKAPCYILLSGEYGVEPTVFYIPADATYTYGYDTNGTFVGHENPYDSDYDGYEDSSWCDVIIQRAQEAAVPAQLVTGEYYEIPAGDVVCENSSDRNAYPDSGIVGDTEYKYLGVPFEKLPFAARCETGSYKGTGAVGSANPNRLTFSFAPKLVIVSEKSYSTVSGMFYGSFTWIDGMTSTVGPVGSYGNHTRYYTQTENGLSWYVGTATGATARMQLNEKDVEYRYFALG